VPPDIVQLAHAFAAERNRLELEVVGLILANPLKGSRTAGRAGFKLDLLKCEDLAVIAGTIRDLVAAKLLTGDVPADHERAFLAVRHELKAAKFWDNVQPAANLGAMLWSNRSLHAYVHSWFYSETLIGRTVTRLADLARREVAVAAHQAAVVELMTITETKSAMPAERAA
jgi:hypothetical protein